MILFLFGEIAAAVRDEAPAGPAGPALIRGLLRADTQISVPGAAPDPRCAK